MSKREIRNEYKNLNTVASYQANKLAQLKKAEAQLEELVIIRKQLRVLAINSIDAAAASDIYNAVELLMKAGKKIMLAS